MDWVRGQSHLVLDREVHNLCVPPIHKVRQECHEYAEIKI